MGTEARFIALWQLYIANTASKEETVEFLTLLRQPGMRKLMKKLLGGLEALPDKDGTPGLQQAIWQKIQEGMAPAPPKKRRA